MMNTKALILAAALIVGSMNIQAVTPPDPRDAIHAINSAGFVALHDLEYRYGLWTAEATTPDGKHIDVLFDPQNGNVIGIDKTKPDSTILKTNDIHTLLTSKGYQKINSIKLDDGLWKAKAHNTAGQPARLIIHPVTGVILHEYIKGASTQPDTTLTAVQITEILQTSGYRNIHDLKMDDGLWKADAINPRGHRVELKLDPQNGNIIKEKQDD